MRLKLVTPTRVIIDEPVDKIVAEAPNGSFCLLPRHVDFLSSLTPGLFMFTRPTRQEVFFAVDEGLLVKCASDVWVSTRRALGGTDLGQLRQTVHEEFEKLDERERVCQSALARLEANFIRRFLQQGADRW
jgi:F-type H+-transporting ATPase subunit epsilon